ncbi:hypothetical protein [Grimontia hollisae]|uniref:hypothetical protein n=1 Tax=Grimontia hollisae TaxID=673 RepID=UPI00165E041F|nr:hypothetical protein [Grimontia hollisae]
METKTKTESVQISKSDNRQFLIQSGLSILVAILTPLLTIVGVKYQLAQEQNNWNMQREVILFEKLQEQKVDSFRALSTLLAEYRRAYRENMYAQYFGSFAPKMSQTDLELAAHLPDMKEELESRAVELSKGELWRQSLKNRADAMENYNLTYDKLMSHIQSSIFFFSSGTHDSMKEFSDYISSSFVTTWPEPNYEIVLQKVAEGEHPWKALDSVIHNDFKNYSESKFIELQNRMIQQIVKDIYSGKGFDAKP